MAGKELTIRLAHGSWARAGLELGLSLAINRMPLKALSSSFSGLKLSKLKNHRRPIKMIYIVIYAIYYNTNKHQIV